MGGRNDYGNNSKRALTIEISYCVCTEGIIYTYKKNGTETNAKV